jgi:transcriptional regulator with XRE-family HTH domain
MRDSVHKRLKQLIERLGLNIKEFSTKSEIPYRTMQDYLAGKIIPGGENLQRMSTVFRVSIDWILTGEGDMILPVAGETPGQYGLDDVTSKILQMLNDMDPDAKCDVLKYAEKEKLLADLKRERLKEG